MATPTSTNPAYETGSAIRNWAAGLLPFLARPNAMLSAAQAAIASPKAKEAATDVKNLGAGLIGKPAPVAASAPSPVPAPAAPAPAIAPAAPAIPRDFEGEVAAKVAATEPTPTAAPVAPQGFDWKGALAAIQGPQAGATPSTSMPMNFSPTDSAGVSKYAFSGLPLGGQTTITGYNRHGDETRMPVSVALASGLKRGLSGQLEYDGGPQASAASADDGEWNGTISNPLSALAALRMHQAALKHGVEKRAQDITVRGQDINAATQMAQNATTERGQNLGLLAKMADIETADKPKQLTPEQSGLIKAQTGYYQQMGEASSLGHLEASAVKPYYDIIKNPAGHPADEVAEAQRLVVAYQNKAKELAIAKARAAAMAPYEALSGLVPQQ